MAQQPRRVEARAATGADSGHHAAAAGADGEPASGAAEHGTGDAPQPAAPNLRQTRAPAGTDTLAARKPAFMVAPRQAPGLQTFSADFLAQQLKDSPDIEVLGQIDPPRLLGLQNVDAAQTSSVLLARMSYDKARQLQAQAGLRLMVERDATLGFGLETPTPVLANPGVLVPLGEDFETTIEVRSDTGPLAGAEVYVFGSVWPTQGVTDSEGQVTLTIRGDTPDTIRAIYVKPQVDYWGLWLAGPAIRPDGISVVTVQALADFIPGFPDRQALGWGQRAMGLDLLPPSFNGSGVKVAIIDSGAAQPTHRNLRQVGPGQSVVSNDVGAWTHAAIGHGSHCAGIIAGGPVGTNGVGIRGFAPAAEVHILQIFPGGKFSSLIQALDYCIEKGIDVVNLSLGGGEPSQIVEDRLIKAKQMGTACIVAAGNSGGAVQFPASTPHVLAVSAVGKWGEFPPASFHATQAIPGFESADGYFPAKFSCFGPEIDVCGPGVAIISSLPDDGFGAWDGTSMAAPHITGMAALVLAHHPDFTTGQFATRDGKRVERLFEIMKASATPLSFGDAARTGAGLPNVYRALGLDARPAQAAASTLASAAPSNPDLMAAVRQLLQALSVPADAGGSAASTQAVGTAGSGTRSAPVSEGEAWQNAPVARGPAATAGNGAVVPQSLFPLLQGVPSGLPAAPDPLLHLRSALQQAGLMARS